MWGKVCKNLSNARKMHLPVSAGVESVKPSTVFSWTEEVIKVEANDELSGEVVNMPGKSEYRSCARWRAKQSPWLLKQHQQSPIMMLLLITKYCQQHQILQSMSQELWIIVWIVYNIARHLYNCQCPMTSNLAHTLFSTLNVTLTMTPALLSEMIYTVLVEPTTDQN